MATLDESDDRRSILADGLRLDFRWTGDRWTHALGLGKGPEPRTLAVALEGEADPTRVVSPAFQQLQFQRHPDGSGAMQALLVGQSGPHHFSAVFTVRESPGEVRVAVEVADRCRAEVAGLASTYVVDLPSGQIRDANPVAIRWGVDPDPDGTLVIEAVPPARIDLREAGRRAAQVQAAARVEPGRPTLAWSYCWVFQGRRSSPGRG